jgi:CheY-like chemotaxis protein
MRRIRASGDAWATVPAVALTAYVRTEDRDMAIEAGFHGHLTKPVEPVDLLRMVQRLAGLRQGEWGIPRSHAL